MPKHNEQLQYIFNDFDELLKDINDMMEIVDNEKAYSFYEDLYHDVVGLEHRIKSTH